MVVVVKRKGMMNRQERAHHTHMRNLLKNTVTDSHEDAYRAYSNRMTKNTVVRIGKPAGINVRHSLAPAMLAGPKPNTPGTYEDLATFKTATVNAFRWIHKALLLGNRSFSSHESQRTWMEIQQFGDWQEWMIKMQSAKFVKDDARAELDALLDSIELLRSFYDGPAERRRRFVTIDERITGAVGVHGYVARIFNGLLGKFAAGAKLLKVLFNDYYFTRKRPGTTHAVIANRMTRDVLQINNNDTPFIDTLTDAATALTRALRSLIYVCFYVIGATQTMGQLNVQIDRARDILQDDLRTINAPDERAGEVWMLDRVRRYRALEAAAPPTTERRRQSDETLNMRAWSRVDAKRQTLQSPTRARSGPNYPHQTVFVHPDIMARRARFPPAPPLSISPPPRGGGGPTPYLMPWEDTAVTPSIASMDTAEFPSLDYDVASTGTMPLSSSSSSSSRSSSLSSSRRRSSSSNNDLSLSRRQNHKKRKRSNHSSQSASRSSSSFSRRGPSSKRKL